MSFEVAKGGDFDAGCQGGFQHGAVFLDLDLTAIDLECYHVSKSFLDMDYRQISCRGIAKNVRTETS